MFEKQSRWIMKLDVTPTQQSSHTLPLPVQSSRNALRENSMKASTVVSDDETVVHSPQKRKMSKPVVVVAEAAAKRRREDGRLFSNDIHESFLQDMLQYARRNRFDALKRSENCQEPRHGTTQPFEMQCDSGISSLPPSPVISSSTTSDHAAIPNREDLHRESILQNYHEFADRRLFKDAGLIISPVSDGERRAYESIFMGDSDEWSSSTEGRC